VETDLLKATFHEARAVLATRAGYWRTTARIENPDRDKRASSAVPYRLGDVLHLAEGTVMRVTVEDYIMADQSRFPDVRVLVAWWRGEPRYYWLSNLVSALHSKSDREARCAARLVLSALQTCEPHTPCASEIVEFEGNGCAEVLDVLMRNGSRVTAETVRAAIQIVHDSQED